MGMIVSEAARSTIQPLTTPPHAGLGAPSDDPASGSRRAASNKEGNKTSRPSYAPRELRRRAVACERETSGPHRLQLGGGTVAGTLSGGGFLLGERLLGLLRDGAPKHFRLLCDRRVARGSVLRCTLLHCAVDPDQKVGAGMVRLESASHRRAANRPSPQ